MIENPLEFSEDFKKELSSLKKVNQVGKKLSATGKYIMYDGMLFAYDKDNASVSISFIHGKLRDATILFSPKMYLIDGDLLYHYIKDGEFIGYEETSDGLLLKFTVEEEVREEFNIDEFVKFGERRGLTKFDMVVAYQKGWETNMEIYNCYLKYIDTLSTVMKTVEESVLLKYVDKHHKIFKKIDTVSYDKDTILFSKDFDEEDKSKLLDSDLPYDITTDEYSVRIMKNMFPTISSKSDISIELYRDMNKEFDWFVTKVDVDDVTTSTIFKLVRM